METLFYWYERYLHHVEFVRELSVSTIEVYQSRLKPLVAKHGQQDIHDISRNDIRSFFEELEAGSSQSATLKNYKATIRNFFQWLIDIDTIQIDPTSILRKKRFCYSSRPVVRQPAPKEDFNFILTNLNEYVAHRNYNMLDVRNAALFSMIADSGNRVGELWNLRWVDIDVAVKKAIRSQSGLTVYKAVARGKQGSSNVLFFDETFALLEHWRKCLPNVPFVWASSWKGGSRVHVDSMSFWIYKICRYFGVPTFGPHAIRKRNVTAIIRQSGDQQVGQKYAGHASIQTTQKHYNDVDDDVVAEEAARLAMNRRRRNSQIADGFFQGIQ